MTHTAFGGRLAAEFAASRHLCVGIDPHGSLLNDWDLSNDAASVERLGRDVIAAAAGVAACVKPQVAFYERFGSAGFVALERVLGDARAAGLLVIADVKRGDIGSSFGAYADAWLAPGSPLESDAMTVAAYQGFGTLVEALEHVKSAGKGLFVLAATSNPEASAVQQALRGDGLTVAHAMVNDALAWNKAAATESEVSDEVGSVGVVLGATLTLADFGIDIRAPRAGAALPVLAPGFGHQGAKIEEASQIFGTLGNALLANESRGVLTGGRDGLERRIRLRAEALAQALSRGTLSGMRE